MKKNILHYAITSFFILSGLLLMPIKAQAIGDTSTLELKTTIYASCTISVPPVVELPPIPLGTLQALQRGEQLPEYGTTFQLEANCAGATSHRYTFIPGGRTIDGCLGTVDSMLKFCLYHGDQMISIATTSANPSIVQSENTTTLRVVPGRDTREPVPSEQSVSLTISISPE